MVKLLNSTNTGAHDGEMIEWPPHLDWVRCVQTAHFSHDGVTVTVQCQDTFGHEGRCTVTDPSTSALILVPDGATW
jgi:hypothetical protein